LVSCWRVSGGRSTLEFTRSLATLTWSNYDPIF
jgi:hypothetical protein